MVALLVKTDTRSPGFSLVPDRATGESPPAYRVIGKPAESAHV